jgi:hypothetical protein
MAVRITRAEALRMAQEQMRKAEEERTSPGSDVIDRVVAILTSEPWPLLVEDVDGAQWYDLAQRIVEEVHGV